MTIVKELPSNLNSLALCSANPYASAFVATFASADVCNSYAQAPVIGSPLAVAYSNCTASSYCVSFRSPLGGSLKGFDTSAVTAASFSAATLEFSTPQDCINAKTQAAIYCGGGYNPICNGSSLIISGCNDGSSGFSIPAGEILTFDLLP